MKHLSVLFTLLLLGACSSQGVVKEIPVLPESVSLETASGDLPRLNVSIGEFSSSSSDSGSLQSALTEVRSMEQRYLPFILKETLDQSSFWGAVRVLPGKDPGAEIMVTGRIISSSGVELVLEIEVRDATDAVWISQVYRDTTHDLDYATDPHYRRDPFQDLFNRIANDMGRQLERQQAPASVQIIRVATMRYAQALSPEAFDRFLKRDSDVLRIAALPADTDPLLERVRRIRESENLFADSIDAHYESLYRRLGPTYAWWRHYHYELTTGNQRLGDIDPTRGATEGSWYAMERIYKTYKESKMNEDALRQLTDSFDRETRSIVADISGRLVQLDGSLEEQYESWRQLLREIYRSETGL
jgi:hypothetical protein